MRGAFSDADQCRPGKFWRRKARRVRAEPRPVRGRFSESLGLAVVDECCAFGFHRRSPCLLDPLERELELPLGKIETVCCPESGLEERALGLRPARALRSLPWFLAYVPLSLSMRLWRRSV